MIDSLSLSLFVGFTLCFILLSHLIPRFARRYSDRFNRSVGQELSKTFVFVSPSRLLFANIAVVLACSVAVFLLFRSPWPVMLVALLFAVLPRLALTHLRRRWIYRFRCQLPEAIAILAGGLRAGAALTSALDEVANQLPAPAGQEFALVLRESRMGSSLDEAVGGLERRLPVEESSLLVSALRIGAHTGGSMATILESLAEAMRRKLVLEGKIRALTAQGRLQAWVMGLLPFLVLAAMIALDPTLSEAYFGSVIGWIVLGTVALLQLIGAYLINQMVQIEI